MRGIVSNWSSAEEKFLTYAAPEGKYLLIVQQSHWDSSWCFFIYRKRRIVASGGRKHWSAEIALRKAENAWRKIRK